MTGWWVHDLWNSGRGTELVSWIFWVFASITLHELAHGWAAIWEGDDTPRTQGRMTANPVVHMGMPSIVVFLIIGIAWGTMLVNPYKFRHGKWGRILVAVAGPMMNLALAVVSLTILGFISNPWDLLSIFIPWESGANPIGTFLKTGGLLNLVLFALNMLPVPPLDGSVILANLSSTVARWYTHPQAQMAGLLLFLALIWSNMFDVLFTNAQNVAVGYSLLIHSFIN